MGSPHSPLGQKAAAEREVHYTTFIRLPFPRRDFVDPPLVEWDRAKERQLWKILSRAPRSADLNWKELAVRFEVTLPFILQQAAWMYERQLSQMREQMRKVSQQSKAQITLQSTEKAHLIGTGGSPMRRQGSSDTSRPRSQVETETPMPTSLGATPRVGFTSSREYPLTTRNAPPLSRTTSTNTITQSRRTQPSSPTPQLASPVPSPLQRSPSQGNPAILASNRAERRTIHPESSSSSSKNSDDDSSSSEQTSSKVLRKSQIFRRAPRYVGNRKPVTEQIHQITYENEREGDQDEEAEEDEEGDEEEEEEEEEGPAFLPFGGSGNDGQDDLRDTLRRTKPQKGVTAPNTRGITKISSQANTDSSVSSATSSAVPLSSPVDPLQNQRPSLGALSPRQQAELAKLSPRGKYLGKDGSEGAPSMGSSFSDLDDASVTQSALEEALHSNAQPSIGNRMSNISQALKSRYL